MARGTSLLLLALSLSACRNSRAPTEAYSHWSDRMLVRLGLPNLACRHSSVSDPCIKMDPPRRWRGLWFDQFEGSRFCPAPATECSAETPGDRIKLDWMVSFPPEWKGLPVNEVYAVDFVGQRTSVRGGYQSYNHEIAGQRLISLKEVKARKN